MVHRNKPNQNHEDEEIEQLLHELDLLFRHILFRIRCEDPRIYKNRSNHSRFRKEAQTMRRSD